MNKIIIIGYKSFLQKNLFDFLKKKKLNVRKVKFQNLYNLKVNNGDIVVNCSITNDFFFKKYKYINDRNLEICKFIRNKSVKFVMLSTRQVYLPKLKITEESKLNPINNYAKNFIISEKNCKKIMSDKITIIRVSNVVGFDNGKKKRLSMLGKILLGIKSKKVLLDSSFNFQKDILPVKFFCVYFYALIKKNFTGLINLGTGQSLTLLELVKFLLNKNNQVVVEINKKIQSKDQNYTYNIKKLFNLTKVKFTKKQVFNELKKIRKQSLNK